MATDDEVVLKPLAGDDSAVVDVVFFHGLGAHHKDTWTHPETQLYWPQVLHKARRAERARRQKKGAILPC